MVKKICRNVFNTETAELVKKFTVGNYGDPNGYEECLYRSETGSYFVYVNGGEASKYPQEDIVRLAKNKVEEWLAERQ